MGVRAWLAGLVQSNTCAVTHATDEMGQTRKCSNQKASRAQEQRAAKTAAATAVMHANDKCEGVLYKNNNDDGNKNNTS